jgi:hypothetical protein
MDDPSAEPETTAGKDQEGRRRRGGWMRKTSEPLGERPPGPPPLGGPENASGGITGAEPGDG